MGDKLDNLNISCVGLRRHSFSTPARLSLERLELATQSLGVRVASLSSLVAAQSELAPTRNISTLVHTMRTCHGCHSPIDDDHKGFPTGADQCPLEHWGGCKDTIAEGTIGWRPCPVVSDTEVSESDEEVSEDKLANSGDSYLQSQADGPGLDLGQQQQKLETSSGKDQHQQVGTETSEDVIEIRDDVEDEDERALRDLEAANALLKIQKAKI